MTNLELSCVLKRLRPDQKMAVLIMLHAACECKCIALARAPGETKAWTAHKRVWTNVKCYFEASIKSQPEPGARRT